MEIELKNIHKYYGPIKANNGISLAVKPGTIRGILGENGAGKSTLMKILAGYSRKTEGSILIDSLPVDFTSPEHAARLGIGMLYQDPLDFPLLTVLENFKLGLMSGFVDKKINFRQMFLQLAGSFNFILNPEAPVRNLTIGERQQLEILRLLIIGVQTLILDEPTTGISGVQKETLFKALKKLASEGKSIILVSHKLEDVEALCDTVTVLRHGKVTGKMDSPFDTNRLLEMMFGETPPSPICPPVKLGKSLLSLDKITASGGRAGLKNCSVEIKEGEIIGLAGLEGSGQGVFLRIASGLTQPISGTLSLHGNQIEKREYHYFRHAGITYLPASRLEDGLIPGLTIAEHFALQEETRFFVRWSDAQKLAKNRIRKFRIKGTPNAPVESLSGGNQQRLLLSFLPSNPILLLLDNPTRGLDVESAQWVWQHMQMYLQKCTSIVFSSSELDEILKVAARVLVFFNGSIIKDVKTCDTDIHELGRAVAGKV